MLKPFVGKLNEISCLEFWKEVSKRFIPATAKYKFNTCTDGNKQNLSALQIAFQNGTVNYSKVKKIRNGDIVIGMINKCILGNMPKEEIGMETHAEHDQFIRVEKGEGKAILNSEEFPLKDGSAVVIPAGTEHNIVNISDSEKMKLYTVYTPPEHPDGTINRNKQEAEECEKRNSSLS